MSHEHVRIAVIGARTPGVEYVPARKLRGGQWQLICSPLYATQIASGDVIKILSSEAGTFEIIHRGGNVSIQFYLAESEADDVQATETVAREIAQSIAILGGRLDGQTAGLIVCTIPVKASFPAIEEVMEAAVRRHPGAQWQYCNVFDPDTGEPLRWWEE
jgi:hypothetical protein